ncbi:MAG: response regulator transcription factor [Pseudomonadota bacterium]
MANGSIRVLIVQRNRASRDALAHALEQQADVDVSVEDDLTDASALHARVCAENISIVLLDLEGHGAGLASLRGLTALRPAPRVVVFGVPDEDDLVIDAIQTGACGVVTCGTPLEDLIGQLHAVANGGATCSPGATAVLFSRVASGVVAAERRDRDGEGPGSVLTPREREVARLIERGLSNKGIARELGIGLQTVKNHVHNILEKLHVQGRVEVARLWRHRPSHPIVHAPARVTARE